jgi:flagellar basal body P-ring protein FlgI
MWVRLLSGLAVIVACLGLGCVPQGSARQPIAVTGQTATALGVVVGLAGTGDGVDFAPLATLCPQGDRRTMALVTLHATVPPGARDGQRLRVRVSALGRATSLQGGRLLPTVLTSSDIAPQPMVVCSGEVATAEENVVVGEVEGYFRR